MQSERERKLSLSQSHGSPSIAHRYDLILFDLDGTLLDTSEGILSSVRYTVDFLHLRPIPDERIRSFIGPPIQNSFSMEYGVSAEEGNRYAAVFRDRYKDHDLLKATPYPYTLEALAKLKSAGCKLAVATYKREDYALKLLDAFGLLAYFDIAHGSDFSGKLTKTDIIRLCIDEAGAINKDKIVLVGDSDSDKTGAYEAGIGFIGVTYGFGYQKGEKKEGASRMVDTPFELLAVLLDVL